MDLIIDKRFVRGAFTERIVDTHMIPQNLIGTKEIQIEPTIQRKEKEVEKYEINEIVSYQIVWKNFVKWVPAKIVKKISKNVYIVSVKGVTKSAHLRQIRKTHAKNLVNWPGIFIHRHNNENRENSNENIGTNVSRSPDIEINDEIVNTDPQLEIRRSDRIAKTPKRNYKV